MLESLQASCDRTRSLTAFAGNGWSVRAQGEICRVAHANKAKQTKEFLKRLVVQTAPKATPPSYTTTLHLKIRPEAWAWLDQAAREVNQVWNWANATSRDAIQGPRATPRWMCASVTRSSPRSPPPRPLRAEADSPNG